MAQRDLFRLGGFGILTEDDLADLAKGTARVAELMLDMRWHTPQEIRMAAGQNGQEAAEGLRRLRELRSKGVKILKQRRDGSRCWVYRLAKEGETDERRT